MRISTRAGRGTYVSMSGKGWILLILFVAGLVGWAISSL